MFKKPSVPFAIGLLQFVQILAITNARRIAIKAHGNSRTFEGVLISDRQIKFDNPDDISNFPSKLTIFYGVKSDKVASSNVTLDTTVAVAETAAEAGHINLETELKITVYDGAGSTKDVVARNVVIKTMKDNIWTLHIKDKVEAMKEKFKHGKDFRFEAENFNLGFISSGCLVVEPSEHETSSAPQVLVVKADIYKMMNLQKNEDSKLHTAKYIPCGIGSTGKLLLNPELTNGIQQNDLFRYTAEGGSPMNISPLRLATNPAEWGTNFSESSYGKQKVKVSWGNKRTVDGTLYSKNGNTVVIEVEVQKSAEQDTTMQDLEAIFEENATVGIIEGSGDTALQYVVGDKEELKNHSTSTRTKHGYRITCKQ